MIGLVFATLHEAANLLECVGAREKEETPFHRYQFSLPEQATEGTLIISGEGKVAAALATQHLILTRQPAVVINAGVCGGAGDTVKIGQVFQVTEAREGDLYSKFSKTHQCDYVLKAWDDLPKARLTTGDQPVYDLKQRRRIAEWGLLIDMEGAAVVRTCNLHGVPCALLKGVTDFADAGGKETLQQNLAMVSSNIAQVLYNGLIGQRETNNE